jgi:tryptophanyl-tRNA synthetase
MEKKEYETGFDDGYDFALTSILLWIKMSMSRPQSVEAIKFTDEEKEILDLVKSYRKDPEQ